MTFTHYGHASLWTYQAVDTKVILNQDRTQVIYTPTDTQRDTHTHLDLEMHSRSSAHRRDVKEIVPSFAADGHA